MLVTRVCNSQTTDGVDCQSSGNELEVTFHSDVIENEGQWVPDSSISNWGEEPLGFGTPSDTWSIACCVSGPYAPIDQLPQSQFYFLTMLVENILWEAGLHS